MEVNLVKTVPRNKLGQIEWIWGLVYLLKNKKVYYSYFVDKDQLFTNRQTTVIKNAKLKEGLGYKMLKHWVHQRASHINKIASQSVSWMSE